MNVKAVAADSAQLIRISTTPCEDGKKGKIVVHAGDKEPLGLFKKYDYKK